MNIGVGRWRVMLCEMAVVGMTLGVGYTYAAELFYMDHDSFTNRYVGAVGPLVISGDIESGDYDRLLAKIEEDEPRFMAQNKIILASEEGDSAEALKIAQLVKSLYSSVSVGPLTGKCAGPCFAIYAAANERAVDGDGLLGIYGLDPLAAFLSQNGLPSALRAQLRRPRDDIHWLTAEEERTLGARSAAFVNYLRARCMWDEGLEREVYAGRRPFSALTAQLQCRARVTREDAQRVLAAGRGAGGQPRRVGVHRDP